MIIILPTKKRKKKIIKNVKQRYQSLIDRRVIFFSLFKKENINKMRINDNHTPDQKTKKKRIIKNVNQRYQSLIDRRVIIFFFIQKKKILIKCDDPSYLDLIEEYYFFLNT
jgi:hypothetical protein